MVSITSLRHSTRTPMSTVPGLWVMPCSAHRLFQPVGAAAAGGDDHLFGKQVMPAPPASRMRTPVQGGASSRIFSALGVEQHLDAVLRQVILDVQVELLGLLGAQMADGAVHQLQTGLDGPLADILDLGAS